MSHHAPSKRPTTEVTPPYVPDLPGCTTCADSVDEIRTSIKDAVDSYLNSLREHHEPIPTPSSVVEDG